MRLLLVRHAVTDWNATQRLQGWTDTALGEVGKRQAALLRNRLKSESIDVCHTSDLRRAAQTATAIAEQRGLAVLTHCELRELHFGDWEGLTYAQVRRTGGLTCSAWEADPMRVAPPGGETLAQLTERVAAFRETITAGGPRKEQTLLAVGHHGSLRVLLCQELGLPASHWWRFRLDPASVSELEQFGGGAVLTLLNDTRHLQEPGNAG
jgi:broad specificity phosphatase PhoE